MPDILNEIGFFQFDNLIRNQIPFVILNLGSDLQGFYKVPLFQKQLEKLVIQTTPDQAIEELKKMDLPSHSAVVVLCPEGKLSGQTVDQLERAGFSNVFYSKGGVLSLRNG